MFPLNRFPSKCLRFVFLPSQSFIDDEVKAFDESNITYLGPDLYEESALGGLLYKSLPLETSHHLSRDRIQL